MSQTHDVVRRWTTGGAATAIAIVMAGGVLGSTAQAVEPPPLPQPDLIGSGPAQVFAISGGSLVLAHVRNEGNGGAAFTAASVRFQPVSRLSVAGRTAYVNMPGASAITATGSVRPILGRAEVEFSAQAHAIPTGLNRITVCADTSNVEDEWIEGNNCSSEVRSVIPVYNG
jgi:hypothetical protein